MVPQPDYRFSESLPQPPLTRLLVVSRLGVYRKNEIEHVAVRKEMIDNKNID